MVCEGARQEILGKHTLLGFFGVTPYVQVAIKDFKIPLAFVFVFAGGPGSGRFRIDLRVIGPNGVPLVNSQQGVEGELLSNRPNTTIILGFQGAGPGPGPYGIELLVNGAQVFTTTLNIVPMTA